MLKLFFLEEVLENLSQTEVLVEQIIEQIDRILKPPELDGTCPSSNGCKYEMAELYKFIVRLHKFLLKVRIMPFPFTPYTLPRYKV